MSSPTFLQTTFLLSQPRFSMTDEHGRGRGVRFNYSLQYSDSRNLPAGDVAEGKIILLLNIFSSVTLI